MTTLERMRIPSRVSNAPLYDWDDLVQEDSRASADLYRPGGL